MYLTFPIVFHVVCSSAIFSASVSLEPFPIPESLWLPVTKGLSHFVWLWMGRHWEMFLHNLYWVSNLCAVCILTSLCSSLIHMPTFTEIGVLYGIEALKCNLMSSLAVRLCLMSYITRIPRFLYTVRFSAWARVLFCLHSVQSAFGAHPTDIGALFLPPHAFNHSAPSNIKIKNLWTSVSMPPIHVYCVVLSSVHFGYCVIGYVIS
jgi:hypothetical protein